MPPDPVTTLAKKHCGCPYTTCACLRIAAAVREALEEAEKIAQQHDDDDWNMSPEQAKKEGEVGHSCAIQIRNTIAALREEQNVPKA